MRKDQAYPQTRFYEYKMSIFSDSHFLKIKAVKLDTMFALFTCNILFSQTYNLTSFRYDKFFKKSKSF